MAPGASSPAADQASALASEGVRHRTGGRVFSDVYGAELASITYGRAWDKARGTVLTSAE
jgi:hypothetical protein